MANSGGNVVPTITKAEHIGPDDTGDNIEAKRNANYVWDGANWQRMTQPGAASGGLTDAELRATPVPVSGTVTATPTGTQNVDVTANTIGLSTSANQTNGTQQSKITDGTNTVAVGSLGDGDSSRQSLVVDARVKMYNGASFDRIRGDTTNGLLVNLGANNDVTVTNAGTFAVQNTAATPTGTNAIGTVGTSANAINVGQKTVSTTAVQISATATVPTNGILVQALAGNTAVLYVGGSGVTTGTGWELSPGQAIAFTCTLNTLYIISVASTTDKICFQVV